MSFSWANKLAKNALLTAKKGIDSVLDIEEEEDSFEDGNVLNEVESFNEEKVLFYPNFFFYYTFIFIEY